MLITYLPGRAYLLGRAFDLLYSKLTLRGGLTEEVKDYTYVCKAVMEVLGAKKKGKGRKSKKLCL